jgi:2,4-dienoyl-CoA reductase-like NADH-dependent reductase (Old Yellow Enzyme family)
MGIFSDKHIPGLRKLADSIRARGAVSSVQLHHGGVRASPELGGISEGPSEDVRTGARGLTVAEVERLRDDFITAALRVQEAGFDGVEVHGAFGWVLTQFLSPAFNRRTDRYGGGIENRARLLFEVIDGIRRACRSDFQIGLRISMERYGVSVEDARWVAARVLKEEVIDYLDLAVWDYRKTVTEGEFKGRTLLSVFTDLPRGSVRLGVSGHVISVKQAAEVLDAGCDFVMLGKAAVLDPSFPENASRDGKHSAPALPVTADWLRRSGLSEPFINYMRTWSGFVDSETP